MAEWFFNEGWQIMAGGERHRADDRLSVLLASGKTVRDAAAETGISESTAFRRLTDPEFGQQLIQARAVLWDGALAQLTNLSGKAVATLGELLDSDSDPVRLQAAKNVLELGTKLREAVDFDLRLLQVERSRAECVN